MGAIWAGPQRDDPDDDSGPARYRYGETRVAAGQRAGDGAQQARAEERCRNRGAHGSVGPMVSCAQCRRCDEGQGSAEIAGRRGRRSGAASAWTRCRSAGRGGRAARQACRHGPELCRRDARGRGAGTRLAWGGGAGRTIRSNAQALLQRAPSALR